jgi:hypothetical protein
VQHDERMYLMELAERATRALERIAEYLEPRDVDMVEPSSIPDTVDESLMMGKE